MVRMFMTRSLLCETTDAYSESSSTAAWSGVPRRQRMRVLSASFSLLGGAPIHRMASHAVCRHATWSRGRVAEAMGSHRARLGRRVPLDGSVVRRPRSRGRARRATGVLSCRSRIAGKRRGSRVRKGWRAPHLNRVQSGLVLAGVVYFVVAVVMSARPRAQYPVIG